MEFQSICLVLLSAVIHVGWNLLVKSSRDPRAFSAVKGLPFLALAASLPFWVPLDQIPPAVWYFAFGSGVVHAIYVIALTNAYAEGDLSLVYPTTRSAPARVEASPARISGHARVL